MVGERFIVKHAWYSGLKHREGQTGEAVRVYPGSAFSRGERVVLEFSDGKQTLFAHSELEPQSETSPNAATTVAKSADELATEVLDGKHTLCLTP